MSLDINIKPKLELLDFEQETYEYQLFDSVTSEMNDISGFPVLYYIKDKIGHVDPLYGEDPNAEFTQGFSTKLLYEPTEEMQILDSFGLSSEDLIQYMWITKSVFIRDIATEYGNLSYKPVPGDVIKTLWNNNIYEIVDVGAESKIFQGKKLVWEFICRPYRTAEESDSTNDMIFYEPDNSLFPDINNDVTTKELSAYGDNDYIEEESENQGNSVDGSYYGYNTLD